MADPHYVIAHLEDGTKILVNPGDVSNKAVRVNVVASAFGLPIPSYDAVLLTQDATHDVWTFKTGGTGGTTVGVVTITYTDATKATISSVVLT